MTWLEALDTKGLVLNFPGGVPLGHYCIKT